MIWDWTQVYRTIYEHSTYEAYKPVPVIFSCNNQKYIRLNY